MIYFCFVVIFLLTALVVLLFIRMRQQNKTLAAMESSLQNRTKESAGLRSSLERRKATHVQNLEDTRRFYEKKAEDERRKLTREWVVKQDKLIEKYKAELQQQAVEIREHYEKQVLSLREIHREHNRLLIGYVEDLIEPATTGDCVKVRCHTDEEGQLWARRFEADRNFPEGSFRAYRCKACPRNPIYGDRYVHITTADPKLKKMMTDIPTFTLVHPRQQLLARFSPGDLANLRKRVQG